MQGDPLGVERETMRELGYRTVDMLIDWLGDETAPPLRRATPAEMRARLSGPAPDGPEGFDQILERLAADVLPFASRVQHPRFFAFIPGSGTWPGALGDFIASAANVYAGSWMEAAGPSQIELEVLRWFSDWLGYPETAGGILVSGGSAANMTALACARESVVGGMSDDVVAYVSDQAHSSLARAARILGFRPEQVRVLPVGADHRLEPRTLSAALDADARAGRRPLFVAASGGATNTGSVDPLRALAEVCAARGVWFHVDAAYGGFAVLSARGRALLDGIELADSIALDPHKWLYQPYECGCLLVRDDRRLRGAFEITPDYLQDSAVAEEAEVNFADRGLQLTRTSRALKLWISLRYFGIAAFKEAIESSLDLADLAARRVESSADLELVAPPSLGIVCFRRRFEGVDDEDELAARNAALVDALEQSGLGLVSSTRVRGRYAIRLCPLNHSSTPADVEQVLAFLESAEPTPRPRRRTLERERDPGRSWLRRTEVDPESLAAIPLFASLSADERRHAAELADVREAAHGERIIEQWSVSRDFYVVLEGTVEVLVDNEHVRTLEPGAFFGELAALDRDAGFAYPRLASIVATSPLRLLVFPDAALNELVGRFPAVAAVVRATAEARVQRH